MKVNVLLFDDFDTLEAAAPLEVFGKLPEHFHVSYYSFSGSFVTSLQKIKIWTDFLDENLNGDILIIPGGKGARRLIWGDEKVCRLIKQIVDHHSFCVMIGSGTAMLAQIGLLYRRHICDFPMDQNWNQMFTAGITRTDNAFWVADGKFYSASSATAGLDMCLNILADLVDLDIAQKTAAEIGYDWDPDRLDGIYR